MSLRRTGAQAPGMAPNPLLPARRADSARDSFPFTPFSSFLSPDGPRLFRAHRRISRRGGSCLRCRCLAFFGAFFVRQGRAQGRPFRGRGLRLLRVAARVVHRDDRLPEVLDGFGLELLVEFSGAMTLSSQFSSFLFMPSSSNTRMSLFTTGWRPGISYGSMIMTFLLTFDRTFRTNSSCFGFTWWSTSIITQTSKSPYLSKASASCLMTFLPFPFA